ncbi:MAG: cofactor-independent phosphoglycerate mutase [Coriobacteriia bacterium]|nr:cofactor-independent phosphoglycerate mutase [Coriobacteriia bacterium]
MKYVVVILDGAAGWPLDALGGRTTLAAAETPNLDALAREGRIGMAQTVPAGEEPSSSAACTSILGYDPVADYIGRGAIEAASMGIVLAPDEIALRVNTVTITDGIMTSYACGHIATEESNAIILDIATALDDDTFRFYPGVAYRHILVVKGHPELLQLAYTPPHDISDKPVAGHLPSGAGAGLLLDLMDRARPLLDNSAVNRCRVADGKLPVTDIWPFWPGAAPSGMVPFAAKWGVSAAMTSGVDLLNGLAVLAGMDRLDIAGVTGGSDNDYTGQTDGALAALEDHDLVVIHVESPDEEGHAGDTAAKVAAIEAIDRDVVSRVLAYAHSHGGVRILAMPDHPTPIEIKTHVGEPVPFLLWGPGVTANGATHYAEDAATASALVLDPGRLVMDELLG